MGDLDLDIGAGYRVYRGIGEEWWVSNISGVDVNHTDIIVDSTAGDRLTLRL